MGRWLKRGLRLLLWLVAGIVGLLVVAFIVLQTPWAKDLVRDIALDALNPSIRGRLEVDEVGGFLPFDARFEGVRIYDPSGALAVSAERVVADLHPWALLDQTVHLSDIVITEPSVTLLDDAGNVRIAEAFEPQDPSPDDPDAPAWRVRLSGLHLDGGAVTKIVDDPALRFSDLTLDVTFSVGETGLRWEDLLLTTQAAAPLPSSIRVASTGELDGDVAVLEHFELDAAPHQLVLDGRVNVTDLARADVQLHRLKVSLGAIPARLLPAALAGRLSGDLTATGFVRRADGRSDVSLSVDSAQLGAVELQANRDETGAEATLQGTLRFTRLAPGVVLSELGEALRLEGVFSGSAVGPLDDPSALTLSGELRELSPNPSGLARIAVRRPPRADPGGPPRFDVAIDVTRVVLDPWMALAGEPKLAATLSEAVLSGQLELPPGAPPRVVLGGRFAAQAEGSAQQLAEPGESPVAVDLPLVFGDVELQWDGAGLPTGDVGLTLADAVVGARRVDFADVAATLSRTEQGVARVDGMVSVQGLDSDGLRIAQATVPVDLTLGDLDGVPEGRLELSVLDARIQGERLATIDADFRVRRAAGGLALVGDFDLGRMALASAPVGARSVSGQVQGRLWFRGGFVGDVSVAVTGLSGVASAASARLIAAVDAPRGLDAEPSVVGTVTATGAGAEGASARTLTGRYDLRLGAAGPVGTAHLALAGVGLPSGQALDSITADLSTQGGGTVAYDLRVGSHGGAVDGALLGVLSLPTASRPLEVALDRFTVGRRFKTRLAGGRRIEVLRVDAVRYVVGGAVEIGQLRIDAPLGGTGVITASGGIDPGPGTLSLSLDVRDVGVARWIEAYPGLFGVSVEDIPPLDGVLSLESTVGGTLGDPTITVNGGLSRGRIEDLTGLSALIALQSRDGRLTGGVGLTWHDGARLQLNATLPGRLRLEPAEVRWDTAGALDLKLEVEDSDLAATQRFLAGVGASQRFIGTPVEGAATLTLVTSGPFEDPYVVISAAADPLSVGPYRQGTLSLKGFSHKEENRLAFDVRGPEYVIDPLDATAVGRGAARPRGEAKGPLRRRDRVVHVSADLPFDWKEVLTSGRPLALMWERMLQRPSAVLVDVPRTRLEETALSPFLSDSLRTVECMANVDLAGPWATPTLKSGRLEATSLALLGLDSTVSVDLATEEDDLTMMVTGSARGTPAVRAAVHIPDLGRLAEEPGAWERLLQDDRMRLVLFSDDMDSAELWDLSPAVGQFAATFMPDARVMLHVNAHGTAGGPVANVVMRLRNARAKVVADDRNLADDVRLALNVGVEDSHVTLRIGQDGPFNAELGVFAGLPLGTRRLIDGDVEGIMALPLTGGLRMEDFGLQRLARTLSSVLGPSRGTARGEVDFSGTLGAPRLTGSMEATFEELTVAAIGLQRDQLTVITLFEGDRISLVPIRLEAQPRKKGGEAWFELAFAATLPALDPARIGLEGRVEMADFPLLERPDMEGRLEGKITVGGTVKKPTILGDLEVLSARLSPELGGRSVRPLGLPTDVTLVSGAPIPPLEETNKRVVRTGAEINVSVRAPQGRIRVINDIMDLYPWTEELTARTVDGELQVFGTIHVPKEQLELYGKKFVLTEDSRVVFTGDMTTDPQLLVSATYDISEIDLSALGKVTTPESRATVRITGGARDPKLTLSSDPPMDEANIVSVIVVGAPAGSGEGEQDALQSQVANLVIGMATGSLSQLVTAELPIDTFNLDTRGPDLTQSRLTLGKRLAKALFFRYRGNLGVDETTESANEFSADYRIGPATLRGQYGDIGEFSLEANLKIRD